MLRLRHLGAFTILALLTMWGRVAPAWADKAVIVHATRSSESGWRDFIKKQIADTGLYESTDELDSGTDDPDVSDLLPYRLVVVLSSDYGFYSSTGLGNALGDYMTMSPSPSILIFYPYTWQTGSSLRPPIGGRFLANYALSTQVGVNTATAAKLGTTLPNDPLTAGLMPFDCGSNCLRLPGVTPKPGATVAATWDDGTPLAIRGRAHVDLNMWPADESVITGSYKAEGTKLISNAILYLSSPLGASPGQVDFSPTPLGGTADSPKLTLKNNGRTPVTITGLGIDGTDKAQFSYTSLQSPTVAKPLVLGPGASFTATARYRPLTQGNHTATLYATALGYGRAEVTLRGSSKGNLLISLSPIDFGGITSGSTKGPVTVTLTNLGATDINMDKPVVTDTAHYTLTPFVSFPKVQLTPGATYRFDLTFNPGMADGEFGTKVRVVSDDSGSPLEIPVRGLAGAPRLQVMYTSVLMPDVPKGQKGLPLDVALINSGNSELQVTDITSDSGDFLVTGAPVSGAPIKILAREAYLFQIVFSPTASGLRTGQIRIKSNEPAAAGMTSDKLIDLAGTGTTPQFAVSRTAIDFGKVSIGKDPGAQTLTITNKGDGVFKVTKVAIQGGTHASSFSVQTPLPTPFSVAPGGSIDASVYIGPKAAGMLSAILQIETNVATSGTATLNLTADVSGAVAQLSTAKLDFGDRKVKVLAKQTVTVQNAGNQTLLLRKGTVTSTPPGAFALSMPLTNVMVAAGASQAIEVTFNPTVAGPATGKLALDTDDPMVAGGTPFTVDLLGNGVTGNIKVEPTTLDFKTLYVGQMSTMQTVKVTNIGAMDIDALDVAISDTDAQQFAQVGDYQRAALKPGKSTEIGFAFAPRVGKLMHKATAIIKADGAMLTVALTGSSVSADISVQPADIAFEKTESGKASAPRNVTVVNNGLDKVVLEVVAPTTADFRLDPPQPELVLGSQESAKFALVFAPQSVGVKSDSVDLRLKGTTAPLQTITVEGEGAAPKPPEPPPATGCSVSRPRQGGVAGATFAGLAALGLLLSLARRRRHG